MNEPKLCKDCKHDMHTALGSHLCALTARLDLVTGETRHSLCVQERSQNFGDCTEAGLRWEPRGELT